MESLHGTKLALRQEVCAGCFRSPAEAAGASAAQARSCEADCDIFYYLPRLAAMVRRFGGEPPCGYTLAVLNLPCRACGGSGQEAPSHQCDACQSQRPLARYVEQALALIEEGEHAPARLPRPPKSE